MPLGTEVGLSPGDLVLDEEPAPRPRQHCVRWGPSSLHGRGHNSLSLFGPCLLWPNGRPSQQLL